MQKDARIYVAGHQGLVGSALVRRLRSVGYSKLLLRTKAELDLTVGDAVHRFFAATHPDYVFIAAARVGGIAANIAAPADFLLQNLKIQNNLLEACLKYEVQKTLFLGSSCMYPRESPQPMREDFLMHGPLEPTNEGYALAKIAGVVLARDLHRQYKMRIICPIPCNVYGPGDHFEFDRSHFVSALVRRFIEARAAGADSITIWGTGNARRELLHVDDLAEACLFLMDTIEHPDPINVGTGVDHTIREVAELVAEAAEYRGKILWDASKPDGMPRKLLNLDKLHAYGWSHRIQLKDGINTVIDDFVQRYPRTLMGEGLA